MEATLLGSERIEVRGGTLSVTSGKANVETLTVGAEPCVVGRSPGCQLVLDDKRASATHLEVVATERGVRVRDLGSTNGTYLGDHRIVEAFFAKPATLRCGATVIELKPGKPERVALSKAEQFGRLVGAVPQMRALFERLRVLSPTNLAVLIEGETGTGKELVAGAIHEASDRALKPFVVIDCGAIPPHLAESTLFGHEKGAFTGALSKRASPFVEANGGTIFLDELGELPVEVQPKLLRVLAEQRIKSVGSNTYAPTNVRVIAATRRELLQEINQGTFRSDLYFRIAQARVRVPPLRERTEDIPALIRHMMDAEGKHAAFKRVTPESLERLARHDWPGNVRELFNVVRLALAYDRGEAIDISEHLVEENVGRSDNEGMSPGSGGTYTQSKDRHDYAYFLALYGATAGNVSEIARKADLDRATVRTQLHRHKIGSGKRARR
jgi:DNA-binding NtrC family response regulator